MFVHVSTCQLNRKLGFFAKHHSQSTDCMGIQIQPENYDFVKLKKLSPISNPKLKIPQSHMNRVLIYTSAVRCTENFGAPRFTSLGSMHRSGIPIFDSIRFRI